MCHSGTDHPRSRGVYRSRTISISDVPGSSPLARGLPGKTAPVASYRGIIPARAGFTGGSLFPTIGTWDHPRSRGVYERPVAVRTRHEGSSPLARGLPPPCNGRHEPGGIIPARAGFTYGRCTDETRRPDHPRSRGVYAEYEGNVSVYQGSSPLARGLLWHEYGRGGQSGIIPARAGFTTAADKAAQAAADHPRSRGVYSVVILSGIRPYGSSPLARGLPSRQPRAAPPRRIIPARAGFTGLQETVQTIDKDHPRSRGVYASAAP